jgi:hypothetical protein
MLRITITEGIESATFRLEGKLIGPWVEELRRCWCKAQEGHEARKLFVDLADVSCVDPRGSELLSEMQSAGVTLTGRGVQTRYLLRRIGLGQIRA